MSEPVEPPGLPAQGLEGQNNVGATSTPPELSAAPAPEVASTADALPVLDGKQEESTAGTTSLGPEVEAQLAKLSPAGVGPEVVPAPSTGPDAGVQPEATLAGNTGEDNSQVGVDPATRMNILGVEGVGTVAKKPEGNDTVAGKVVEPGEGATESFIDKATYGNALFEYAKEKGLDPKLALNDSDVAEALGKVWAAEGVVASSERKIEDLNKQLGLAMQRLGVDRGILGKKEQELQDAVKNAEKGATASNATDAGDEKPEVSAASTDPQG